MAIAAMTVVRLVRDVDFDHVLKAIQAKPVKEIAIAFVFVALGYFVITFYDFFTLRVIGCNRVPYRFAAFASFTAFTIGHNLGAVVFTAALIRFRVYSAWGLNVLDITKIAFITGLTFWLGNAFVLGAAMAWAPEAASAIDGIAPWINRLLGLTALAVIGCYLSWLLPRPRIVGRNQWQVLLPNAPLTLVQIGIAVLDLTAATAAMSVLLPAHPVVNFVTLLVIFVSAMLLGFLSHSPGSLGVVETAMLIGLSQFPKEELLASLLLFRLMYFVLPFLLAVLLLGGRELWLAVTNVFTRRGAVERT